MEGGDGCKRGLHAVTRQIDAPSERGGEYGAASLQARAASIAGGINPPGCARNAPKWAGWHPGHHESTSTTYSDGGS